MLAEEMLAEKLLEPKIGMSESKLKTATAISGNVLSGKTFYAGSKDIKTGTMTNRGAWSGTFSGGNDGIPAGYHNRNYFLP